MSRVYPHKLGPRGFNISKRKSLPFTDEALFEACHTTTNMSDDDECVVCYDRPRAVRTRTFLLPVQPGVLDTHSKSCATLARACTSSGTREKE